MKTILKLGIVLSITMSAFIAYAYAQEYKISGKLNTKITTQCDCPDELMQATVSYSFMNKPYRLNVCIPYMNLMEGQSIAIQGELVKNYCDENMLLMIGDIIQAPPLYTAVFTNKTTTCQIINEGILSFYNGAELYTILPRAVPSGTTINVNSADYGLNYCSNKYFQVYNVKSFDVVDNQSKQHQQSITFSGNYRSLRGVRHEVSTISNNAGYFTYLSNSRGNSEETIIALLDRMRDADHIQLHGRCSITGYFEEYRGYNVFFITSYRQL